MVLTVRELAYVLGDMLVAILIVGESLACSWLLSLLHVPGCQAYPGMEHPRLLHTLIYIVLQAHLTCALVDLRYIGCTMVYNEM